MNTGHALAARLEGYVRLSSAEKAALQAIVGRRVRHLPARQDVVTEGEPIEEIRVMLDGWAVRCKHLPDGRRQILSFLLPGDICDPHALVLAPSDHTLATLTPATIAELSPSHYEELLGVSARVAGAMRWQARVDSAIQREWTLSLGRRLALERLAHLICELKRRLEGVGMVDGDSFDLPPTQIELSEAMGLSAVHVNRVLQQLREFGLITLKGHRLTINRPDQLEALGLFNADYLHRDRERSSLDYVE